ncbi:GGDEF domain-containing protein (plasmid) [Rhizobium sp. CB3090]|nr:GGDEF domain-containing protein [Rhizobium sp. CB3090]WFU12212.1 GGDEF domain-containing protein [Rhizobium sp. CB3090]
MGDEHVGKIEQLPQIGEQVQRADTLEASYQKLQKETDILANAVYLDALTGLYNRKYLDSRFKELTSDKRPYSIAMLDVDHFKSINDNFSHMIGDQVLSAIGTILRNQLRITDQAIRFGGEEFVVLLAGPPRGAADVCERQRSAVEHWDWSTICNGLHVTISIGVAGTLSANLPNEILEIADQNLYAAKRGGRNQVVAQQVFRSSQHRHQYRQIEADHAPHPVADSSADGQHVCSQYILSYQILCCSIAPDARLARMAGCSLLGQEFKLKWSYAGMDAGHASANTVRYWPSPFIQLSSRYPESAAKFLRKSDGHSKPAKIQPLLIVGVNSSNIGAIAAMSCVAVESLLTLHK